jgi:hypothetical protein
LPPSSGYGRAHIARSGRRQAPHVLVIKPTDAAPGRALVLPRVRGCPVGSKCRPTVASLAFSSQQRAYQRKKPDAVESAGSAGIVAGRIGWRWDGTAGVGAGLLAPRRR